MQRFNPLDHPVCFSAPLRLAPSGWLEHVPLGMFLVDLLRPSVIVELGTHNGVSYCSFCQAVKELGADTRCFAVDTWEGDPHAGFYGAEVLEDLRKHHDPLYGSFSRLVQSTFDDALTHFADGTVDLLHIDGYHTYEAVKHDFESWLPKVSRRGVVLVHDTDVREGDFGVWQFWSELKSAYRNLELAHGNGLGLAVVGDSPPPALTRLLDASQEDIRRVRSFFHQLGERVVTRFERDQGMVRGHGLEELTEQIRKRDLALVEAQDHIAELTADIGAKDQEMRSAAAHLEELTEEIGKKQAELDAAAGHVRELTERLIDRDRILRTLAIHSGRTPDQLRDEDEITASLDTWIEGTKQQVEDLKAQLIEREQALKSLSSELVEREQSGLAASRDVTDLRRKLAEKERLLQEYSAGLAGWEAHWAGVQRSLAWRFLVVPTRRMRRLAAPENSFRERVWFRMWGRAPRTPGGGSEGGPAGDRAVPVPASEERLTESIQTLPVNGNAAGQLSSDVPSAGQAVDAMATAKLRMFLAADGRLTFPVVAHPQVSVVIPLYNQARYTLMTLENLLASESDIPYEVVLVDNGSSDETLQLLGRLENVRIHRNETNQGFGEACNRGAEMAFGRYVCFLNNDALPSPGWLGALVGTATRFPRCAAVGGKLVLPDGRLQEAGSFIWEDGSTLGYGRDGDPLAPEFCYTREVDYCSAACLLVEKELFRSLGGFDARYAPAYYEDADLCMAIRDAGHTVMYEPRAVVLHLEHGSSNRGTAVALQLRNRERFAEKWKAALAGRGLPAPAMELLRRDSRSGKRVLVIDDRVPELRLGSGFPRTRALIDALAQTGYVVSFLPTADPRPIEPVTSELQEAGLEILYGVTNVEEKLEERANLYDVVIVSRPHNARFIESVRRTNPKAAIIYDAEAVYALRESAQAEIQGRPIEERVVEANIGAELAPVSSAELVLTVSEVERATILRHYPQAQVGIWGHAVPVQPGNTVFAERRDIVFVGYLASEPNTDAALHLLNAIMPRVFERLDCRLILVGADPRHEVREAAKQFGGRVELAGYVENLDEVYNSARVFVAPHRFAAGIPLKVVEAMAHGLPCVVSPLLARQLGAADESGVLVGADADDFARRIVRLYEDEELWRRMQGMALGFVRAHHDPQFMKDRLEEWIEGGVTRKQRPEQRVSIVSGLA